MRFRSSALVSVLLLSFCLSPPDKIADQRKEQNRHFYKDRYTLESKKLASEGWHAECVFSPTVGHNTYHMTNRSRSITFERIPSDYAILKITQLPADVGGDTLWASGYEAYDRLSPAFQKVADSLTATHYQPNFVKVKNEFGAELIDTDRGAPENSGLDFQAEQ